VLLRYARRHTAYAAPRLRHYALRRRQIMSGAQVSAAESGVSHVAIQVALRGALYSCLLCAQREAYMRAAYVPSVRRL